MNQSALKPSGTQPWADGELERFDTEGTVTPNDATAGWSEGATGPHDGSGVVRRCVIAPTGLEPLLDHAVIDHDRARVELVDARDPAALVVTKFPHWGDASELIEVLGNGAIVRDTVRPVVEGSQLLGQAVVAAMRQAPGRRVVSAHMSFLRAADANQPVAIVLEPVTSGRTFTAFSADAVQGDRRCATGTLLLGVPADDVVQHGPDAEEAVPGPYDAIAYDMGVTGRDIRVVDAAYTDDPAAPVGPPIIDAWVRFRDVPDEQAMHAGLLAQFTGHMSIAAALRPHEGVGQREAHRSISTAINAIAISFHADVYVDRWVRYRHLATVVSDGMSHAECRAYDEAGTLLASFTVDAMIRPLNLSGADARTAL